VKNKKTGSEGTEAEQALIGACLLDPDAYGRIAELCSAELLSVPVHARIYRAIDQVAARGDCVDMVSVADALSGEDPADYGLASWINHLAELPQVASMSCHLPSILTAFQSWFGSAMLLPVVWPKPFA